MSHDLDQLESYSKLKGYSQALSKFTEEGLINRLSKWEIKTDLFTFNYAFTHLNEDVLNGFKQLVEDQDVFGAYMDIRSGKPLNYSEDRAVLHQQCRHPEGSSLIQEYADEAHLFSEQIYTKEFCTLEGQPYTDIVQIGIGGSRIGGEYCYHALKSILKPVYNTHFLSTPDRAYTMAYLKELPLETTLFVVVSKSGNTSEIHYLLEGLDTVAKETSLTREALIHNRVVVTMKDSDLDQLSMAGHRFYIIPEIGGRFSGTSIVTTFLMGCLFGKGVVDVFLEGAYRMDQESLNPSIQHNSSLMSALLDIWHHTVLSYPTKVLVPYTQYLSGLPALVQQLVCESLGKHVNAHQSLINYSTAPIVFGSVGSDCQHSYFQLLHQGTMIHPIQFVAVKSIHQSTNETLNDALVSQLIALALGRAHHNPNRQFEGQRPSTFLLMNAMTPESIGALLAFYENTVMFYGLLLNLNSFDQEGVQLGKEICQQLKQGSSSLMIQSLRDYFLAGSKD